MKIRTLVLASLALAVSACSDLGHYSTAPGERWVGCVVAADFLRRGFSTATSLSMTLHVEQATCPPSAECPEGPGLLSTSDGAFAFAVLGPIEAFPHDMLSQLSFGNDRVRSWVFAMTVSGGALAGRDATAFVSLMKDDTVEVRIVLGRSDLFGIFRLHKTTDPSPPVCP